MNFLLNGKDNLDEVVFADRNKAYGAYALRRSYDATLSKALLVSLSLFVLLFLLSALSRFFPGHVKRDSPSLHDTPYEPSRLELVIEMKLPPTAPAVSLRERPTPADNRNYRIKADRLTGKLPKAGAIHSKSLSSLLHLPGLAGSGLLRGPDSSGLRPPYKLPPRPSAPIPDNAPEMPEFPGGTEAMQQFLQDHMRTPSGGIQREGTVVVDFVVETDGTLSQLHIGQSLGFGYDEEALRVVELMPKWKPGRDFRPVPVRLHLPIHFVLN